MKTYIEYTKAVKRNAAKCNKFLKTLNLRDLNGIVYWDGTKLKVTFNSMKCKVHDILACGCIGALPNIDHNGADGYKWDGKSAPVEVETKLCTIDQNSIALGVRGALYYSTNLENYHSKALLESKIAGLFDANMSTDALLSKNRETYMIVSDDTTGKFVDAWVLSGKETHAQLSERIGKFNTSLSLKLQVFLNNGEQARTVCPVVGFDVWKEEATKLAKKKNRYIMRKPK